MARVNFGMGQSIPPITKNLLIINVLVFFAQMAFERTYPVYDMFGLHHYTSELFKPYQLVTHMFMHGGFMHLFFNMFALYMFGGTVERLWTPKKFFLFYFACGLGAAAVQMGWYAFENRELDQAVLSSADYITYQMLLAQQVTVGASGAIMGLLVAFGFSFPNTQLIVFPIPVPIKAKWAITGMIALDVFGGFASLPGDQVAHFAHLGGAVTGLIMLMIWKRTNRRTFY